MRRMSGWASSRQLRVSSGTGPSTRTRSGSASPSAVGNGPSPTPDFTRDETKNAVVARRHFIGRNFLSHSPRGDCQALVEADEMMLRQILDTLRLAVAFDIAVAGIDRPDRIRDLRPTSSSSVSPERKATSASPFDKIEIAVAGDEFDAQPGMAGHESRRSAPISSSGTRSARGRSRGSRRCRSCVDIGDSPFEILHRGLDALGIWQQASPIFGQAIAGRMPRHQRPPTAARARQAAAAPSTGWCQAISRPRSCCHGARRPRKYFRSFQSNMPHYAHLRLGIAMLRLPASAPAE